LPNKGTADERPVPTTFGLHLSERQLTLDQFVVLIARHERRVRSFITTLAACRSDVVDDVLQTTYLVAWQKLTSFTYVEAAPDEELVRWMCTIARFEVMTYLRRYGESRLPFEARVMEEIADVFEVHSDALESRHLALKECLDKLSFRQREMLKLRYWREMSVKELAAQRGQEANAVYTALSRIRKILEQCIRHSTSQEGYSR
jgi:RNA polymerase sigma-70 factor, ECF subfamily